MVGNIENLPSVLTGGCTIDSEDVVELWRIGISVVEDNKPMEENTPYVGAPVTDRELYDGQVWGDDGINPRKAANHHCYGTNIMRIRPSIVTNLTLVVIIPPVSRSESRGTAVTECGTCHRTDSSMSPTNGDEQQIHSPATSFYL